MSTYLMFGKYSPDSVRAISPERTQGSIDLIKKNGGELKGGYALLGEIDLVLIVDLPDTERAMKVSAALGNLLGISFSTAPAVSIQDFDQFMG